MIALLHEQAALLERIDGLRALYRRLKKLDHPNQACWLSAIQRESAQLQRQFDLNLNRLHYGVFDAQQSARL